MNKRELADRLEEIRVGIADRLQEVERLLAAGSPGSWERARKTWWADIRTALDDDHDYASRSMTMADTIARLEEMADEEEAPGRLRS